MGSDAKKPLNLRIPAETSAALDAVANLRGCSKSVVVLEAIDAYLALAHMGYGCFRLPWLPQLEETPLRQVLQEREKKKRKPPASEREGSGARKPEGPATESAATGMGFHVVRETDVGAQPA